MLSKRARPYDAEALSPSKRYRENLRSLAYQNTLPVSRIQSLINDARDCGHDLGPNLKRRHIDKNLSRSFWRAQVKNSDWPEVYWAQIRLLNLKTKKEEPQWVVFLLPHELLETVRRLGVDSVVHDTAGMDPKTLAHLRSCESKARSKLLAWGLWGDGVPCNWERTE